MTGTTGNGKSDSADVVLSAVADEHRRAVLRTLDHADGRGMDFETLVDRVTERIRRDGLPDERHRHVRTALHHVHLPKLDACGMLTYDAETKRIRNVDGEPDRELLALIGTYEGRE